MKKLTFAFVVFVTAFFVLSAVTLHAQEVVLSDEFDSGDGLWSGGWIDASATSVTVSVDTTGILSGKNSYKLVVANGSVDTYRIQRNAGCPLFAGYQYTLSFMAVADSNATINALFELSGDPYTKRLNETAQVTATPQTFTYIMSSSEDVSANQVKLHFGGVQNNGRTIWVDNIIVSRIADPSLVTQWGILGNRIGNWKFAPVTAAGGASIGGDTSLSVEWAAIRGEFTPITATTTDAILVTGKIEFVGAGIDVWSGMRYGLFRHDSAGALITSNVDSTRWSGSEAYCHGYMFSPISGTQRVTDGASGGVGTQWIRPSGNYISTSTGSGPIYTAGVSVQRPVRAVAGPGVYEFAFSVQPQADGTKQVRFYLIKGTAALSTNASYYFGGQFTDTTTLDPTFNGVVFAIHATGSGANPNIRGVKLSNVKATTGTPFEVPEAPWSAYYVDKWGFLGNRIGNWHFIPDPVIGNAGIGGDSSLTVEWSAIRGEFFEPITATNAKALKVTGKIEFVGAGIDVWSGLRYGLFQHDSAGTVIIDTAAATLPDSTRWSGAEAYCHGYMFSPISGTQRVTDGASGGVGTQWIRPSGNYISTSTGSGPIYTAGVSTPKPARAVAGPGVYEFAFCVQPQEDGTKQVRFYLIKGTAAQSTQATYYFGGQFTDTTSLAPTFNGVVFAVHATGSGANPNIRGLKLTDVKVDIGRPFTVPEAPWNAYYVDKWGFLGNRIGNWHFIPDPAKVIGNAGIGGDSSLTVEWSAIRGEFLEPITATNAKSLVVTGKIEFVGAGIDVWSGLRYGLFQHDSAGTLTVDTAIATLPDSTRWSGSEANCHGYMFSPISGTQRVTDGASGGVGTQWIRVSGNYISTSSGSGPIRSAGVSTQKPARAVAGPGVYDFAFSVQPQADGTKEVRFYLIKGSVAQSAQSTYYFGDKFIDTTTLAPTFNGVVFAIHATGSGANPNLRGLKLTDVKVDIGAPFEIPESPWGSYYVDKWGFYGGRMGGWHFTPGGVIGNAAIEGSAANTDWAAIRGEFDPFVLTAKRPLKITGQIQLVGGGFDANGLRFGIFNSENAGSLVVDSATATLPDSTRWTGSEASNTGYLIVPPSGTGGIVSWNGLNPKLGTYGAVVNDIWLSTGGENSYALGSNLQTPENAVGEAGTYDFAVSVTPSTAGKNEVRYSLANGSSYILSSGATDNGSAISKINSIVFALNKSASTTALKLIDVKIDTGTIAVGPLTDVGGSAGARIPKEFSLNQNYPNPFNPSTTIRYDIPMSSHVTLTIYDILGRAVAKLVDEKQSASTYTVQWNASHMSSGVYFYRINAQSENGSKTFTSVKKLLLMK